MVVGIIIGMLYANSLRNNLPDNVKDPADAEGPLKSLKAFERVEVKAGKTAEAVITLDSWIRARALPLSILSSVRLEPSTAGLCDVDW